MYHILQVEEKTALVLPLPLPLFLLLDFMLKKEMDCEIYGAMSTFATVTLHSSDSPLLVDLTVTLHRFISPLNFNSIKKELFVIVTHEKYTAD